MVQTKLHFHSLPQNLKRLLNRVLKLLASNKSVSLWLGVLNHAPVLNNLIHFKYQWRENFLQSSHSDLALRTVVLTICWSANSKITQC